MACPGEITRFAGDCAYFNACQYLYEKNNPAFCAGFNTYWVWHGSNDVWIVFKDREYALDEEATYVLDLNEATWECQNATIFSVLSRWHDKDFVLEVFEKYKIFPFRHWEKINLISRLVERLTEEQFQDLFGFCESWKKASSEAEKTCLDVEFLTTIQRVY